MAFNFVVDKIIKGRGYPALAKYQAKPYTQSWRQFVQHWPYTVPVELIEYCQTHGVPCELYTTDNYPKGSYYPIHIGFFDFDIDYIGLLPETVKRAALAGDLYILFYYHEGDNPFNIKIRLDNLCQQHNLPTSIYRFVSGNTAADLIDNFIYFPDHELLYYKRDKTDKKIIESSNKDQRVFTALTRTFSWWRATALADLYRSGLLNNSYWSFNPKITVGNQIEDCPIEIDSLKIRNYLNEFIAGGPYTADNLSPEEHNDHTIIVEEHYKNSYCNIVFETHFDADQSGGAFLTEKTFKPIRHGQPFVIVGPVGSLQTLRNLGYRTFDHCIDNRYDLIKNNTERWQRIRATLAQINSSDLVKWRESCQADVEHNQQLFLSNKADRLNRLLKQLQTNDKQLHILATA